MRGYVISTWALFWKRIYWMLKICHWWVYHNNSYQISLGIALTSNQHRNLNPKLIFRENADIKSINKVPENIFFRKCFPNLFSAKLFWTGRSLLCSWCVISVIFRLWWASLRSWNFAKISKLFQESKELYITPFQYIVENFHTYIYIHTYVSRRRVGSTRRRRVIIDLRCPWKLSISIVDYDKSANLNDGLCNFSIRQRVCH